MKRRRFLYALAVLAGIVALVLLFWPDSPVSQTVTLSDGTRLTLRAVKAGTNSTFRFGGPFRRLASRIPIERFRRWGLQTERRLWFGDQTNLVLWFASKPLAPNPAQYQFRILDEFGTNTVSFRGSSVVRLPGSEIATCFSTPLWPRRSRFLTVQAFADLRPLGAHPEWEFQIRNPIFGDYPQWPSERFPATRTVGDSRFTLWEVLPNRNRRTPDEVALGLPPSPAGIEVRLRIDRDGQPCDDWSVCGVQFRDATGNSVQTTPADVTRTGSGRWWVRVPTQLFAGEESARIGVGFVRHTNVPTNDTFVLSGVPVRAAPAKGAMTPLVRTNPIVGRVNVTANIAGSGSTDGWVFVASAEPLVRDVSSPQARWFLVLSATDDQGRLVTADNRDLDASMSRRLALRSGAQSLDITVAAPRIVFVEWTVSRAQISGVR